MNKIKIALYDEVGYVKKLQEYMEKKKNYFWDVIRFSSKEKLQDYMKHEKLDVLLLGEEVAESFSLENRNSTQIIVLSEGEFVRETTKYPVIFKYQSAEEIVREIKEQILSNASISLPKELGNGHKMIWIALATLESTKQCGDFGRNLGREIAKSKQTLYLDFNAWNGYALEEDARGMSELIFYLKQRKDNLGEKISVLADRKEQFYLIEPVSDCRDLFALEQQDVEFLMQSLMAEEKYEVVLLEIPASREVLWRFFPICDHIYLPEPENEWERRRQYLFQNILKQVMEKEQDTILEMVDYSNYSMIAERV